MSASLAPLTAAVPRLDPGFRAAHARLWHPDHLARLAARLDEFRRAGGPSDRPLPYFEAETTPPLGPAFEPFRAIDPAAADAPDRFAAALAAVGGDGVLLLLGQRRTPATLTDARGVPPTDAALLASAGAPTRPGQALTVAARALAKHAGRSADRWWGTPSGPAADQNAGAARVLEAMLAGRTWWNVFGHFQHDTVFEARLPSGHGARWGHDGAEFIGFLEPFDAARCPSLTEGRT